MHDCYRKSYNCPSILASLLASFLTSFYSALGTGSLRTAQVFQMLGLEAYVIMPDYKQQTSELKINKS